VARIPRVRCRFRHKRFFDGSAVTAASSSPREKRPCPSGRSLAAPTPHLRWRRLNNRGPRPRPSARCTRSCFVQARPGTRSPRRSGMSSEGSNLRSSPARTYSCLSPTNPGRRHRNLSSAGRACRHPDARAARFATQAPNVRPGFQHLEADEVLTEFFDGSASRLTFWSPSRCRCRLLRLPGSIIIALPPYVARPGTVSRNGLRFRHSTTNIDQAFIGRAPTPAR